MRGRFRRRLWRYWPILKYLLGAIIFVGIGWTLFALLPRTFPFWGNLYRGTSFVKSVLFEREIKLKQTGGRTNILLLGTAGGNHEGADLADTLIFLSTDLKTGQTLSLSLPRDIWLDSLQAKINTAYAFGEEKREGGGLVLAKAAHSEILGQPLHYAVKIDFLGFEQLIDLLGGVEIEAERSFDDYKYPIPGKENDECEGEPEFKCRFEPLHFDAGRQLMNGERALKYARSRQAEGEEGTDFARARRQQKLLLALRKKVFSLETIFNPGKILKLQKTLGKSLATDINFGEIDDFLRLAQKAKEAQIKTLVLDQGDEKSGRQGFLVNPSIFEYGAWVLVPRTGNWREVQEYVRCHLEGQECPEPQN